jgi:hypothetical protein
LFDPQAGGREIADGSPKKCILFISCGTTICFFRPAISRPPAMDFTHAWLQLPVTGQIVTGFILVVYPKALTLKSKTSLVKKLPINALVRRKKNDAENKYIGY